MTHAYAIKHELGTDNYYAQCACGWPSEPVSAFIIGHEEAKNRASAHGFNHLLTVGALTDSTAGSTIAAPTDSGVTIIAQQRHVELS